MTIVKELKEVAMAGSTTLESRITTATCRKTDLPAKTTTSHRMDTISMANATNLTRCNQAEVEVAIGVAAQTTDSTAMVPIDITKITITRTVTSVLLAGTMIQTWGVSSEAETTDIRESQDMTTRDQ